MFPLLACHRSHAAFLRAAGRAVAVEWGPAAATSAMVTTISDVWVSGSRGGCVGINGVSPQQGAVSTFIVDVTNITCVNVSTGMVGHGNPACSPYLPV